MSNNLFAFNVSQEIPASDIIELEDSAGYDANRQVWKGTGSTQLGTTNSQVGCKSVSFWYCCGEFGSACQRWCPHYDTKIDSTDTDQFP